MRVSLGLRRARVFRAKGLRLKKIKATYGEASLHSELNLRLQKP